MGNRYFSSPGCLLSAGQLFPEQKRDQLTGIEQGLWVFRRDGLSELRPAFCHPSLES